MSETTSAIPVKILFVDDEKNILLSLKRLMLDENYEVFTASSGEEGLELLRSTEQVGVIVSDQRMPGLTGVDFLEKAREIAPEALRIMLTGYADLNATMDAINKGGAYRYITKPWDDQQLVQTIREATQNYQLLQENRRLNEVVNRQNEELKEWNTGLKERVMGQTVEIRKRMEELHTLNQTLRQNYEMSIQAFSRLIELHDLEVKSHSRNVAELSCRVAKALKLPDHEIETIRVAALLHDIGKIGIPEHVLLKDPDEMESNELELYSSHPVRGQTAIDSIEDLREAGILIRHHHERFDGRGYPDRLQGRDVPLGARIIAVADFIDRAIARQPIPKTFEGSLSGVKEEAGKKFDPELLLVLAGPIRETYSSYLVDTDLIERELMPKDLLEGMLLAKDFYSGTGLLLLGKGAELDAGKIQSIKRYYALDPVMNGVFVLVKR
jgi:response regulator RpfG family c-di-GMP phosphodiesterase